MACSEDGPTTPDGVRLVEGIETRIDALFAGRDLRESAARQVERILEAASAERAGAAPSGAAQALYFDFLAFASAQVAADAMLDPNGDAAPTTDAALAELAGVIADEAGLAVPDVPALAFTNEGVAGTLDAAGGTIVTGDRHAGIQLPAGALPGKVLITITRIPETGNPANHEGPLSTTFPQFPRFYAIETFPEVPELGVDGVVGLCVVGGTDPYAPGIEVLSRLRIARPHPDEAASIEVLALASAPFLDCASAGAGQPSPSGSRIGGSFRSFLPFGRFAAIDPMGTAPTITSVTPNPIVSSTVGGSSTPFDLGYEDPDADVEALRVIEISDPNQAFTPGEVSIRSLATGTSGSIQLLASCSQRPGARCMTGAAVLDFVLIDARGNESDPYRVTILFE